MSLDYKMASEEGLTSERLDLYLNMESIHEDSSRQCYLCLEFHVFIIEGTIPHVEG